MKTHFTEEKLDFASEKLRLEFSSMASQKILTITHPPVAITHYNLPTFYDTPTTR
jgi:hypothetical protein